MFFKLSNKFFKMFFYIYLFLNKELKNLGHPSSCHAAILELG